MHVFGRKPEYPKKVLDLKLAPCRCEATVLTTTPPCRTNVDVMCLKYTKCNKLLPVNHHKRMRKQYKVFVEKLTERSRGMSASMFL